MIPRLVRRSSQNAQTIEQVGIWPKELQSDVRAGSLLLKEVKTADPQAIMLDKAAEVRKKMSASARLAARW